MTVKRWTSWICKQFKKLEAERDSAMPMDFRTKIEYYSADMKRMVGDDKGLRTLEMIFKALRRVSELYMKLTPEQMVLFMANLAGQCINIFGPKLISYLDVLARKYGLVDFVACVAMEMGRRRGKSQGMGIVNGIFMCCVETYNVMIINLDSDVAKQGVRYAFDVIEVLANDPEHIIPVRIEQHSAERLEVTSIWGTTNYLYSTPNVELSGGKVRIFYYFPPWSIFLLVMCTFLLFRTVGIFVLFLGFFIKGN